MSFSQELKDFVSGWNTSSKLNTDNEYKSALTAAAKGAETRASDPATLKLAQDTGQERLKSLQEANKSAPVSRGYTQALTESIRANRERAAKEAAGETTGTGLLPGGPALRSTITPDSNTPIATTTPTGAIPTEDPALAYADGGVVPDESDDDEDIPAPVVGAVGPISDATDFSARGRTPSGMAPQLLSDAHSAVKGGYKHLEKEFGLGGTGIKTAAQKQKALAFQKGAGGLSPQEMDAARKTIDPKNELTESQRNLAALGAVYQFWQNKGDGEKAQRVAGQMLQHYRTASERYAAIAAHAAEQGNLDVATQAAVKAYANVPDGRDMTIRKTGDGNLIYEYTDENGKTLSKGIATPQQLASSAMGLVQGGFDKALLSAAGQREEEAKASGKGAGKAVGGDSGPSPSDRKNMEALFTEGDDSPIAKEKAKWAAENKDKPMDAATATGLIDLKDTAIHILGDNPNLTHYEAFNKAKLLLQPGKHGSADFAVTDNNDGTHTVKFDGGGKLKISEDQLETTMNTRAAHVKAARDKAAMEENATKTPSRMDQAIEGAKQVGKSIAGATEGVTLADAANPRYAMARRLGPKVADALSNIYGEHIPQSVLTAIEDTKSAFVSNNAKISSDLRRGADALSNKGAIPDDSYNSPM